MANLKVLVNVIHDFPGGCSNWANKSSTTGSTSSKISTNSMRLLLEKIKQSQLRKSTKRNYQQVWRQLNKFAIKLDQLPSSWEEHMALFIAHLIDQGGQSSTIKSYVSAIKSMVALIDYQWDKEKIMLSSLTRACRLINDRVTTRLPIQCRLLDQILFEVGRIFDVNNQPYLNCLYKALFAIGYYGLLWVGELTESEHAVRARNVHIADNKNKMMFILYSSKTHHKGNHPQKIKIVANKHEKSGHYTKRHFCPFTLANQYIEMRGKKFYSQNEQFFIFWDHSPVKPTHANKILKLAIHQLGLNETLYSFHGLRIGRTSDLVKYGYSIEEVRHMGRWKSNVIYNYVRL